LGVLLMPVGADALNRLKEPSRADNSFRGLI
jgi:hypothetical protein